MVASKAKMRSMLTRSDRPRLGACRRNPSQETNVRIPARQRAEEQQCDKNAPRNSARRPRRETNPDKDQKGYSEVLRVQRPNVQGVQDIPEYDIKHVSRRAQ